MKIGTLTLENNIFLAPMAGITDLPFRKICRRYGASLVYTEMVSAKGLHYRDKKTPQHRGCDAAACGVSLVRVTVVPARAGSVSAAAVVHQASMLA